MAIRAKKQNPWLVILIIAGAVALWAIEQRQPKPPAKPEARQSPGPAAPSTSSKPSTKGGKTDRQGNYEIYRNCTLAPDRNNDGDSFLVLLPDGRREIFRLYFVDTPESAFKSYRNGENNHERIQDQASYFRISAERAVEIGQAGKHLTLDLLGRKPFTIYTSWDSPFHDQRYHAFVELTEQGPPRWLHEILVGKGLARLKTKPAELPDGTSASKHRADLETLKEQAMRRQAGAWRQAADSPR